MAIKKLKNLKAPLETDVIHTLPEIKKWYMSFHKNLSSDENELKDLREEITDEAVKYTNLLFGTTTEVNPDSPVIGTGHQAIWHHCGILAKDVIAEALSRRLNATNIHIILDHDIKEAYLKLPMSSKINFEVNSEVPLEFRKFDLKLIDLLSLPQNAFCKKWNKERILKKASSLKNLPDSITFLQSFLKSQININPLYLPVSRICNTTAFELFVQNIIGNSEEFVQIYNDGLENLTQNNPNISKNIKSLEIGEKIDLPFWLLAECGERFHLRISPNNNGVVIYANDKYVYNFTPSTNFLQCIRAKGYSIRPKAITLMLFLRLYLFDWFIHGIGGGKYEPITDYILSHFYKKNNTAYGIVSLTSTLLDDKNQLSKLDKDIQRSVTLNRQMLTNPEKFYNPIITSKHFEQLTENKKTAVETLKMSDISKTEKDLIFKRIKVINSKLFSYIKDKYENVLSDLEELSFKKEQLEVYNQRDHFFGLFPEEKLAGIVNRTLEDECFIQPIK